MRGVTIAFLNEDGTFPIASNALNMAVMYGARMSAHCFSSQVGSGSRQDCLLEDSLIRFWTSSLSVSGTRESQHTSLPARRTLGMARSALSAVYVVDFLGEVS